MIIHCIHTGSTGNCYLVEYDAHKMFMLDCGATASQILDYCRNKKLSPNWIEFCLISHTHIDHLADDKIFSMFSIPIYLPIENNGNAIIKKINLTHKDLIHSCEDYKSDNLSKFFIPEKTNIKVYPFSVKHDANTLGFKIVLENNKKIVYITDFGVGDSEEGEPYTQSNTFGLTPRLPTFTDVIDNVLIECNWDTKTILTDHSQIAQRSKKQHCSNECCKYCLEKYFIHIDKSNVLLLHRSGDRLNPKYGYKIFENLDCLDCRPILSETKYEYDVNNKIEKIVNSNNQIEKIELNKLNKK